MKNASELCNIHAINTSQIHQIRMSPRFVRANLLIIDIN
ncbi:hypothetical protein PULV_a3488 [Pseudoalteromonas ulvae UL12]|nr:hypothetical protein [Pseudoalteromonas ulvae UL12]